MTRHLTTTPHQGETRVIYGPDLDLLSPAACIRKRLQDRCQPAFAKLLGDMELDTTMPTAK